jgi:tetratricopeptide (TPR) repeat protein
MRFITDLEALWSTFNTLPDEDDARLSLLFQIGNVYAWLGNNVRAIAAFEWRKRLAHEQHKTQLEIESLLAMGWIHGRMQNYTDGLECFTTCLNLRNEHVAAEHEGLTWMGLGSIHGKLRDAERMIDCFSRSMAIYRLLGNSRIEAEALRYIISDLLAENCTTPALDYLLRLLEIVEKEEEEQQIATALCGIAGIHQQSGSFDSALEYARRGLAAALRASDRALQGTVLLTIGEIYDGVGRVDEALSAFGEGLAALEGTDNEMLMYRLHEAMAALYEHRGDLVSSLEHYKYYMRLREEYNVEFRERKIAELQVLFDVELAERQRELPGMLDTTAERSREMTSLALSLVQKSRFLLDLKRQVTHAADSWQEAGGTVADPPSLYNVIGSVETEEAWNLFEQQFDEVHRDFTQRLAKRYPLLTPMELKICTLTRLDMTSKEIARLLNLSVRNIQNHRYRLRKKLGLASLVSLSSFLTGI